MRTGLIYHTVGRCAVGKYSYASTDEWLSCSFIRNVYAITALMLNILLNTEALYMQSKAGNKCSK